MSDDSGLECEPHNWDPFDSELGPVFSMKDMKPTIMARPKSVWPNEGEPKLPVGSITAADFSPARILREKQLVFSTVATPTVDLR